MASVIEEEIPQGELDLNDSDLIVHYNTLQKESYSDVLVNPALPEKHRKQALSLLEQYKDIFTDIPKVTNLGEHKILLKNNEPVQCKPYPVPYHLQPVLAKEIDNLLKLKIIEPSESVYASPVVMVKKPDGSIRICIDFKRLNLSCFFDPSPVSATDDIFNRLGGSKVYSKFDLSKEYYQVPLSEDSKDLTSFVCFKGSFRFNVCPFGLASAPGSFSRIMRKLLDGGDGLDSYLDDVLAHTTNWDEHLSVLKYFFERVRQANLSLRPSKCQIGYNRISFLGNEVIEDMKTPSKENLEKILNSTRPVTKTQVKSYLGLTGFFQIYVPNYSELCTPLTDLLEKSLPNKVVWGERQEQAFQRLKTYLLGGPILKLPDLDKEFVLRTDASNYAIAGVLMQEHDSVLHPISFISKKLSDREFLFPVSEKECLAVVWSIQRFNKFLYGKKFILETDHKPLTILKLKDSSNPRLQR